MEVEENRVLLMLGSNTKDASVAMSEAIALLKMECQMCLVGSQWISEAWGFAGPAFLNQVVEVEWEYPLDDLLKLVLRVEKQLGRIRNPNATTYENRRMDIDLILWSGGTYQSEFLEVPHPRMHMRRFVMKPLAEHWGHWVHPVQNLSVQQLLAQCGDENLVHLFQTTEN